MKHGLNTDEQSGLKGGPNAPHLSNVQLTPEQEQMLNTADTSFPVAADVSIERIIDQAHIIINDGGICMCGEYEGKILACGQIIARAVAKSHPCLIRVSSVAKGRAS